MDLKVGEYVDILRKTEKKDVSNWVGPCRITDLSDLADGFINCKWQGRPMSVRVADVRRAMFLEFLHFASNHEASSTGINTAMRQVTQFAD